MCLRSRAQCVSVKDQMREGGIPRWPKRRKERNEVRTRPRKKKMKNRSA